MEPISLEHKRPNYAHLSLNPKAELKEIGRRKIYGDGTQCWVSLPWVCSSRPPAKGAQLPRIGVECPPIMKDPVFTDCAKGEVSYKEEDKSCECTIHANPPFHKKIKCPDLKPWLGEKR